MARIDPATLPYRRNVGAMLLDARGFVWMGRRAGMPEGSDGSWQCPQGGIDQGEEPAEAVLRELEEETGTRNAAILAEHPAWLRYDLPAERIGVAWKGRFRGQEQRWFALRFLGEDREIDLGRHGEPEFDAWEWVPRDAVIGRVVEWKQPIYRVVLASFQAIA